MSRAEMDELGWDQCDVILVTGDAYIDHPSFGMALVGRLLEAQGYKVGIISQPDWNDVESFRKLGKPRLYWGITAGNMDSMVNRYTADRKIRSDDAYTPGGEPNKRPDRAVTVYAQKAREAFPGVPVVVGSIEASLRRIAHYDYWSDKVRRSVLIESKADLLIFGNAERALVDLTRRIADGESIKDIKNLRGTAFMVPQGWLPDAEWSVHNSTRVDVPGRIDAHPNPYAMAKEDTKECATENAAPEPTVKPIVIMTREERLAAAKEKHNKTVVRLPSYDTVKDDPVMYAHASRVFHLESNPGNARALVQGHGDRDVWMNPPPLPLQMDEMDNVYDLEYARAPHPSYGNANIPAWEMIRFSVNIMRGCFGGCTFCSITEHEGRIIQSRSEPSILREIEHIRDKTKGFTGIISDLGGPTANMYRLSCKDKSIEETCRRLSCVYPSICVNLGTDHSKLIQLYRKAREIKGVKKILIQSGLRYDLAVRSPEYVKELVTHHVGGLLKIAPEHTETNVLSKMMKPGIGAYDEFKAMFEKYSLEAGQEAVPDPLLHRRPPGHDGRGHAEPGPVAEEEQLPPRPGADLHADSDGDGIGHVPLAQEPAAQSDRDFGKRRDPAHAETAPGAQGLPALLRSEELADPARNPAPHGPWRPDWRWRTPPDPAIPRRRRELQGIVRQARHADAGPGPAEARRRPASSGPRQPRRQAERADRFDDGARHGGNQGPSIHP